MHATSGRHWSPAAHRGSAAELDDFIAQIDAEDGVVDGKMEPDSRTGRLHFPEKKIPDGTFRKMDGGS